MSDISDAMLEDQVDDSPSMRDLRAALRRAKDHNQTLATEAATTAPLAKENAFLKAGINPASSPMAQFLYDNYGDELNAEAIKAKASELGVVVVASSAPASEGSTPPPENIDPSQSRERTAMANDALDPTELPEPDPVLAGYAEFHQAMRDGATRDDAAAAVIGKIVGAANAGDPRFAFDAKAWVNQPAAAER